MHRRLIILAILGGTLATAAAARQAEPPPGNAAAPADARPPETKRDGTRERAEEIVTQPVRDVGVAKTEIPPLLEKAAENPYGMEGAKTCKQLATSIGELNAVLGPDYAVGNAYKENRAGKLAEAGGKTVINAFIPFRGLVREITGAAPAQRRLNAAIDAGYARRGFLRGLHEARRCRTRP